MSYILEALRKAERERNLGQVPSIERSMDEPAGPRRRGWLWVVAFALLINAGVLAAWLLGKPDAMPPVETAVREVPVARAPSVSDYLPPATTVVEEPIEEAPIAPAPVEVEPPPEPEVEPIEPAAPTVPNLPEPESATPDVADLPAVEDAKLPLLRDLPADFRRSLPAMKVDAHFHTDVPGRSFAMINLRKYKVGERLSEGPQLVDILVEGVVLEYQGQRFLLVP